MTDPEQVPTHLVFQRTLERAVEEMKLSLPTMAMDQLTSLFEMLAEVNVRHRLVADAAPEAVALRHIADSLLLLTTDALTDFPVRYAVDMGSGAGFPGLPLAIAQPDIHWLLIESTGKKARFIEDTAFSLGLDNLAVSSSRTEALAHNAVKRASYDLVVARAVASAATLCELGLPFLKIGGRLVAYKGPEGAKELEEATRAAELCGGTARPLITATLPVLEHDRSFLVWEKIGDTPSDYPRREGIPAKRPLR